VVYGEKPSFDNVIATVNDLAKTTLMGGKDDAC
jgi:hypothetical protein